MAMDWSSLLGSLKGGGMGMGMPRGPGGGMGGSMPGPVYGSQGMLREPGGPFGSQGMPRGSGGPVYGGGKGSSMPRPREPMYGGGMGGGMPRGPVFGSLAPMASAFMGNQGYGDGAGMGGDIPTIQAPQRPNIQMPTPRPMPQMPTQGPMMSGQPLSSAPGYVKQAAYMGLGGGGGGTSALLGTPWYPKTLGAAQQIDRIRPQGKYYSR